MNREEFSSFLVTQRELKNTGKNELCRITGFTFVQLQRLEGASNNYGLNLVCKYLEAINSAMLLIETTHQTTIKNYDQLIKWLIKVRKTKYSGRSLAEATGISYSMVARIETKKSILTIDAFLKIINALECSFEIKSL